MNDESVRTELREFVTEREWQQFHTPENLAKSISIEAGELLECAIGHNIAAIVDALGGDADRNVVNHRFEEIPVLCEFLRELALVGTVLMGGHQSTVGQFPVLDQNRAAIAKVADIAVGMFYMAIVIIER